MSVDFEEIAQGVLIGLAVGLLFDMLFATSDPANHPDECPDHCILTDMDLLALDEGETRMVRSSNGEVYRLEGEAVDPEENP